VNTPLNSCKYILMSPHAMLEGKRGSNLGERERVYK
jgi:hypothetical protein